jgi:hypothetical protein
MIHAGELELFSNENDLNFVIYLFFEIKLSVLAEMSSHRKGDLTINSSDFISFPTKSWI